MKNRESELTSVEMTIRAGATDKTLARLEVLEAELIALRRSAAQ